MTRSTDLADRSPRLIRIDLGCGSDGVPGTIGVDQRRTPRTQVVCDIRRTPFPAHVVDEVYANCVLEHFRNPYEVLDEIVRVLKPTGCAYLRVPNLGTMSAHLDPTHCFLGDLNVWRSMFKGYFHQVKTIPFGTKYYDNKLLAAINWVLVHGLRFFELSQAWDFVCRRPRAEPTKRYMGWWLETPEQ